MQSDDKTDDTAVDQSNDTTNASDGEAHDKGRIGGQNPSRASEETKTQDLAKAGRDDFDPNAGQE